MNRPLRVSLTTFCAPNPRPAPSAAVMSENAAVASGATREMIRITAVMTTTVVTTLLSTPPSARVRCTTRAACTGEAMRACVSSTFCLLFTPETTRLTVRRITNWSTTRMITDTTMISSTCSGMPQGPVRNPPTVVQNASQSMDSA